MDNQKIIAKTNLTQDDSSSVTGNTNNSNNNLGKNIKCSKSSPKHVTSGGVTIRSTKSTLHRPVSSFSPSSGTSTSSTLSKNQNKANNSHPANVDMNMSCSSNIGSFAFFSPCNSINESFRKKSGSVSGLYLCDTASTKAKKAELKNVQNETNLKDLERQQFTQTQSNSCFNTISASNSNSSIHRRNSMGKKASVERNINQMNNLLIAPQQNKEYASTSMTVSSNGTLMSSNEYSMKKSNQNLNVFDRLSRSSRKLV